MWKKLRVSCLPQICIYVNKLRFLSKSWTPLFLSQPRIKFPSSMSVYVLRMFEAEIGLLQNQLNLLHLNETWRVLLVVKLDHHGTGRAQWQSSRWTCGCEQPVHSSPSFDQLLEPNVIYRNIYCLVGKNVDNSHWRDLFWFSRKAKIFMFLMDQ